MLYVLDRARRSDGHVGAVVDLARARPALGHAVAVFVVDSPAALATSRRNSQSNNDHMKIYRVALDTLAIYVECSVGSGSVAGRAAARNPGDVAVHSANGEV